MKQRYVKSLGLLAAFIALACILTACPTGNDDPPEPTIYTVTFDTDGGSEVPEQKVEEGKTLAKPADPTKDGYTFANWYRDKEKKTRWDFDLDVVVQDTTLYAKWVEGKDVKPFKVTFDVDGGTPAPKEQEVFNGEPLTKPTNPTKEEHIFDGWYNGDDEWDFATDTVSADITLKAKWSEAVTITFNTNGGSAIKPATVRKGGYVELDNYQPSKADNVFGGWYTDEALKTPAGGYLDNVTTDTTLYAKWIPTSELEHYAGVWRSDSNAYWLQKDGTAWGFSSDGYFSKNKWSTSQIGGYGVTFNDDKTTFTQNNSTYTKNTTQTKPPDTTTTDNLLGTWIYGSGSQTVKLKTDKTAVFTFYGVTITLNYYADSSAVYLLTPDNLDILSISITDGKLGDLSKLTSDTTLAGIWKLTEDGQDFYWEIDKDGKGTFRALGASVSVSFTVTANKEIDGSSYTVSDGTLTLSEGTEDEATLTKVTSVPSGSGFGGDARLHGTWKMTLGDNSITIAFNSDGTSLLEQGQGDVTVSTPYIWKADGSMFYLYGSGFGSLRSSKMSYTVSGSTLIFYDWELTKQ
ncbi:MAG: InlB B-repeat-containing protein [Treponema sp.]|jgi:uncharacterized repeat protein (TIGR02543 family)|nr:InlB B-repeat-containing protein [Treponema sp.]